jgi:hypothetical protein
MAAHYPSGTGSIVAIAGHPLHPMAVSLPIGALILALGADIGFWITQNPFWVYAATWLLLAALVKGARLDWPTAPATSCCSCCRSGITACISTRRNRSFLMA